MFQLAVYCSRNRGYNSRYVLARICKMPQSEWLLAACMAVDAMAILHNLDLLPLGSVVARLLIALRRQAFVFAGLDDNVAVMVALQRRQPSYFIVFVLATAV